MMLRHYFDYNIYHFDKKYEMYNGIDPRTLSKDQLLKEVQMKEKEQPNQPN